MRPRPSALEARTLRTHSSAAAVSLVTVVSITAEPKRTLYLAVVILAYSSVS
jgi:hypothetical protein